MLFDFWKSSHDPPCCLVNPTLRASVLEDVWYFKGTLDAGPWLLDFKVIRECEFCLEIIWKMQLNTVCSCVCCLIEKLTTFGCLYCTEYVLLMMFKGFLHSHALKTEFVSFGGKRRPRNKYCADFLKIIIRGWTLSGSFCICIEVTRTESTSNRNIDFSFCSHFSWVKDLRLLLCISSFIITVLLHAELQIPICFEQIREQN